MKLRIPLIIGLVFTLSGCGTHKFVPTGMSNNTYAPKSSKCGEKMLRSFPKDVAFEEIGISYGQTPGGGVMSDKTPEAIAELQECACLNGGDAFVLASTRDSGFHGTLGGYSQQVAKAEGIVIVFTK